MKMSDELYQTLKWLVLIAIPALGTFLSILLPSLGVEPEVVITVIKVLTALSAFIGTLIGISTVSYNSEVKKDV